MRSICKTMRAAMVEAPTRARIVTVDLPEPDGDAVRVRLEGCGVCGSNLAPWEGRPWFKYPLAPGELGHEGWGVVDSVGPEVRTIKTGDPVAMLSYRAYAEHDVTPETHLIRLPPALKNQPFPGEPLGCAMNIYGRSDIKPGQKVAIIGIGFMGGLLTSLISKAGAYVIAISRRKFALDLAKTCGAVATIPLEHHQQIVDQVMALTLNQGCDRVIEAVGLQRSLDLAGEITRERGRLIIAGYHQDGLRQVNMQLWNWRGIDVVNAHERDPKIYLEGMAAAIKAIERGELDPSSFYTHMFKLDQISSALNSMRDRPHGFLKAFITL